MSMIRRLLLAVAITAGISSAFAAAPPPVPALPDTDRVQSYSLSGSTCACSVGFALYGDSTDYQNWLQVYINGVAVLASDPSAGWTITSPTGPISTIPRPITDGVLTFATPQTGTVTIIGARRPRRVSQFSESQGVAARDLNQALTDIVAQNRENWDLWERALVFEPGFFPNSLPLAAARAGSFFCFDGTGQPTTCVATTGSTTFTAGTGVVLTGANPTVISTLQAANSQGGNYTLAPSDCGKTVVMSGGLFTLTFPSSPVSNGFSNGCEITIKDGDTGRGKKLSGQPSDLNSILWPLQSAKVKIVSAAWTTTHNPGRWLIPATTEVCARQDGSDTSDGLGNGTVAADCFAHVQTAVITIGKQWDGAGYYACNIGAYAGGTNTFNETVSPTGQSVGCYLTINVRGAVTFTNSGPCFTDGDGGILIFNANLGFVPILQCNTSNTASSGAFYGHQVVIFDINGSFEWIPGGLNDNLFFMDAQGRATFGLTTLVVGDGNARAANSILDCDSHCSGLQISGVVAFSPNMTLNQTYVMHTQSYILTTASYTGSPTVAGTSNPTGGSILITNGTSIPGGTTSGTTGGQVCVSKC